MSLCKDPFSVDVSRDSVNSFSGHCANPFAVLMRRNLENKADIHLQFIIIRYITGAKSSPSWIVAILWWRKFITNKSSKKTQLFARGQWHWNMTISTEPTFLGVLSAGHMWINWYHLCGLLSCHAVGPPSYESPRRWSFAGFLALKDIKHCN